MNSKHPLVVVINSFQDIEQITNKTLYININCDRYDRKTIDYFNELGENYYYSDCISKNCGYNYTDYQTFKQGNKIIENIIRNIPQNLTPLEITRYIYIQIAKHINYDINALNNKNIDTSLNNYLQTSNIWCSLKTGKGTVISYVKIFYYLCRIMGIDNEIVCLNTNDHIGNKIMIEYDDQKINFLTDITQDTPYIQANFKTKYFGNFNDEKVLDHKVGYIKEEYNDEYLNRAIGSFETHKNSFLDFLKITQNYLPLSKMGQVEIGIVYDMLLKEYKPMDKIYINNMYINKDNHQKIHFILFSDSRSHFSYNYKRSCFVEVTPIELQASLKNNEIGVYLGETIPLLPQESSIQSK